MYVYNKDQSGWRFQQCMLFWDLWFAIITRLVLEVGCCPWSWVVIDHINPRLSSIIHYIYWLQKDHFSHYVTQNVLADLLVLPLYQQGPWILLALHGPVQEKTKRELPVLLFLIRRSLVAKIANLLLVQEGLVRLEIHFLLHLPKN